MKARLHAAGAGGLEGPARIVQPDVATRHHLSGNMHIVILNKDEVTLQIAVLAEVNDMLDVAFAVIVARVGFAGKNKLNWPRLIAANSVYFCRDLSRVSFTIFSNC